MPMDPCHIMNICSNWPRNYLFNFDFSFHLILVDFRFNHRKFIGWVWFHIHIRRYSVSLTSFSSSLRSQRLLHWYFNNRREQQCVVGFKLLETQIISRSYEAATCNAISDTQQCYRKSSIHWEIRVFQGGGWSCGNFSFVPIKISPCSPMLQCSPSL